MSEESKKYKLNIIHVNIMLPEKKKTKKKTRIEFLNRIAVK